MWHDVTSFSERLGQQLTEPLLMNTTGLLLKRGKTYHWRVSLSGKQLWKSLQTSDHKTAVLRSRYLAARVAATKIEGLRATGSVLIERIRRTMDQALKDIIARWVEGKLDETEQARAVSPSAVSEGDEKEEYTEADIWADLWEESTEQLEENRLYIVADLARTLLQGLQLEPSQLLRFQRELLKARAGLYREETKRARGDYSTYLEELRQSRGAPVQPSPLADPPRPSVPIGEAFAGYMREHNYR